MFRQPLLFSHSSRLSSVWIPRFQAARHISTATEPDHEEFFRYTGGRYLWNEESQMAKRYKRFNVSGLQKVAAQSVNARECVSMTKLPDGGFNKAFRLLMDNGSVVIARLPNPNAGPAGLTTASEVATMEFVRYPQALFVVRNSAL
jgi:hypothetical protein